ncbi:COP9 signalosome complex subunit 5 [Argentina anserina]|uniref:COP9 signalosome complex subunit 5 n=1 Tax=Argentina anserina TaxID=57926 RepID=UPI00217642D7|nr:COP9 signalosome complex subunit 5 [Potentilla anserina]XP_050382169.1 COP9 signalosome complex subunit 5 [Potentilla anserina]
MSLTCVKMSEDVWLTCMTHALSTETEEIMGLLLGDIENSANGGVTAVIWGASPQTRSDRRKDRVETNPEQLAAASAQAERMTLSSGRTTRVIGWYHSHPHITVLPSHVDVRTQAMYQLLDSGFIGLIFSCFSEDVNKVGRIQVIAFQSSDGKQHHMSRPISLSPVNRSSIIEVESSLSTSEGASVRSGFTRAEAVEQDTADSRTSGTLKVGGRSSDLGLFFAGAEANGQERERVGGNYPLETSANNVVDIDPMDMSDSMQEAMHRSNLDMSGAEYVRKEVPLYVLPTSSLIKLNSPLMSFTELQRVLYEEERAAYNQAIVQNMRDGKMHPLTFIHHTSMYQSSMCKLIEYCLSPAIDALQCRLRENEIRLALLTDEVKGLENEARRGSESSSGTSRQVLSPALRGNAPLGHKEMFSPAGSISPRSVTGPGSRSRKGSS